jgi:hypothetical protein
VKVPKPLLPLCSKGFLFLIATQLRNIFNKKMGAVSFQQASRCCFQRQNQKTCSLSKLLGIKPSYYRQILIETQNWQAFWKIVAINSVKIIVRILKSRFLLAIILFEKQKALDDTM